MGLAEGGFGLEDAKLNSLIRLRDPDGHPVGERLSDGSFFGLLLPRLLKVGRFSCSGWSRVDWRGSVEEERRVKVGVWFG